MKTLYAQRNTDRSSDWHHTAIEGAVKRHFGSYAGLARSWNESHPEQPVSRHTLVKSARQRRSELGEIVISWALGVPAAEIWPSRYDENGERIKYRRRAQVESSAPSSDLPSKAEIFEAVIGIKDEGSRSDG